MTTPAHQSATDPKPDEPVDEETDAAPTGDGTPRAEVTENLPLPNDPVDATGLLSPEDLTGEAPD